MLPDIKNKLGLYAAFDLYPSYKGAATHIRYMAQTLFDYTGGGALVVLGNASLPSFQLEAGNIEIYRFLVEKENFIERVLGFGSYFENFLTRRRGEFAIKHFRDPWTGIPILNSAVPANSLVYEVNGLPSIELPTRYPRISCRTLERVYQLEQRCIEESNAIVTPSRVTRDLLVKRGCLPQKISVIPNGAIPLADKNLNRPSEAPLEYLLYFGALQEWQGVHVLLKALALLPPCTSLVVCSSVPEKKSKALRSLAEKLGVGKRVIWKYQLDPEVLSQWVAHATLTVAPLLACPRNLNQGCSPLKVFESLAAATPVIASKLPVIEEILTHGEHGLLVQPNRPAKLARVIAIALNDREFLREAGSKGQTLIKQKFSWTHTVRSLHNLYQELHPNPNTALTNFRGTLEHDHRHTVDPRTSTDPAYKANFHRAHSSTNN